MTKSTKTIKPIKGHWVIFNKDETMCDGMYPTEPKEQCARMNRDYPSQKWHTYNFQNEHDALAVANNDSYACQLFKAYLQTFHLHQNYIKQLTTTIESHKSSYYSITNSYERSLLELKQSDEEIKFLRSTISSLLQGAKK